MCDTREEIMSIQLYTRCVQYSTSYSWQTRPPSPWHPALDTAAQSHKALQVQFWQLRKSSLW